MPTTAWRRPASVALIGDGLTAQWNQFDSGVSGDELSDSPAGYDEVYWFSNSSNTQFSSTAYASDFGFSADGIGPDDRIDGIELETITQSSNGSRDIGFRVLALTKLGSIEQSENKADRVLDGATVTRTYGAADDTWGVAGLTDAIVEATAWGVLWRTEADTTSGREARVTSMRMRIHYTVDGLLTQITFTGLENGGKVIIYDDDSADPQELGTELQRDDAVSGDVSYTYGPAKVGDDIVIKHLADGFKPFERTLTLGANSTTFEVLLVEETN